MDTQSITRKFTQVYDSQSDALFRFCLWKMSDREGALDIAQESFMRYWNEISKGADIENDRAFLYTVARRLVIDWYRKKKAVSIDKLSGDGDNDPFDIPDEKSIDDASFGAEGRFAMEQIRKLDPQYRQAVYLRFVEGLPPKDIALILDMTANVVSVRIDRGLKELREMIAPKNNTKKNSTTYE